MAVAAILDEHSSTELVRLVCAPHATESFVVHSAVDATPLGTLPQCTPEDIGEAALRIRDAQRSWAAMPAYFRLASLRRLPVLMLAYREFVADVVRAESGMPSSQAFTLADRLAAECRALTGSAVRKLKPVKHRQGLSVRSVTRHDPLGLVGIVPGPDRGFDPVPVAAALLAGNGILLVPEGRGCLGALLVAQLAIAARLPRELVQVVSGATGLADSAVAVIDHLLVDQTTGRQDRLRELGADHNVGVSVGSRDVTDFTTAITVDRR